MAVKRPMLWLSASFVAGMYLFAIFDIAVTFTVIFCALIAVIFKILKTKSRFDCVIYIISLLDIHFAPPRVYKISKTFHVLRTRKVLLLQI